MTADPYRNPFVVPGTQLLKQGDVTPAMAQLAVQLLRDQAWPMFAQSGVEDIDGKRVIARLEWHPPEPSIQHWHRGVTLYEVVGDLQPEGIDVSNYQPTIQWPLVKRCKEFVFLKATEGVHTHDASFDSHWEYAVAFDIPCGAYHFFHPELDAVEQAKHFVDALASRSRARQPLPPVLDVEIGKSVEPHKILDGVFRWCEYVQAQLRQLPVVYTMPGFWNTLPVLPQQMNAVADLWVAHWDVSKPSMPKGWDRWTFWQYGAKLGVAGVGAQMDVNRFNGSAADFQAYLSGVDRTPQP